MIGFLHPLYAIVGSVLSFLHKTLSPITDNGGGVTWAVSIVILTVMVRLLVFPLFVKQIRSQRSMTKLQPEIKALQEKYKGDRQGLGEATMKLYKEKGVNPISGCLPLVLQAPAFIALYGTLSQIARVAKNVPGMSDEIAWQGAQAKIFGTPIAAGFDHVPDLVKQAINPSMTSVNLVTTIMILLMGASTFFSARQMMARATKQGTQTVSTGQQKMMLYMMPAMLIVFGFIAHFPLGVLIYMLTSNLWTFGQQHFVIGAMDRREAAKGDVKTVSGASPVSPGKGGKTSVTAPVTAAPTSGGPVAGLRPGEAGRTRKRPPNTPKGGRT
ncbi:MAG: rane protein insertase YidC [Frankiales bacterium]|nr:rane protein insertase YidC [Frankiales bacterium]